MNTKNPNPLLGALVVLIALWLGTMAYGLGWQGLCGWGTPCEMGGCATCDPGFVNYLAGGAAWLAGLLVVLGGFWCAWRLGTGRWSLRRRPAGPGALG